MNSITLKDVKLVYPGHPDHGKILSFRIVDGRIDEMGQFELYDWERPLHVEGLCVSPSWIDCSVHGVGQGTEAHETIESFATAAINGGFSRVVMLPDTDPLITTESDVQNLRNQYKKLGLYVHPLVSLYKDEEGKELTDLRSLQKKGAKGAWSGKYGFKDAKQFSIALQYSSQWKFPLFETPVEKSLVGKAGVHESLQSTRLGLQGTPSLAELLKTQTAIELQKHYGGRLHFISFSSKQALDYYAQNKNEGLSCGVALPNLTFNDEQIPPFDSNYKFWPPIRAEEDRLALIEGLKSGLINVLVSNHKFWDPESKRLEFDKASFDCSIIEVFYNVVRTMLPEIDDDLWVEIMALRSRQLLGLPKVNVEKYMETDLTLFFPKFRQTFIQGYDRLTPDFSCYRLNDFSGKALGVINPINHFIHNLATWL